MDCSKIENISVARESQKADIPPMVVVTLNVHAALDTVRHINEIVMVAVLFHHNYHVDKAPPKPPFDQHCCSKHLCPTFDVTSLILKQF